MLFQVSPSDARDDARDAAPSDARDGGAKPRSPHHLDGLKAGEIGGWLMLCSGLAFSGCAPLELGLSCASLETVDLVYSV